jgi:hypothetical protein
MAERFDRVRGDPAGDAPIVLNPPATRAISAERNRVIAFLPPLITG